MTAYIGTCLNVYIDQKELETNDDLVKRLRHVEEIGLYNPDPEVDPLRIEAALSIDRMGIRIADLIAALRAADEEIGILRTEKHGDAEGIMNLQNALRIAEADRDNSYARGLSAGWRLCSIRTEAMIAALRAEKEARERAEAMVAVAYREIAAGVRAKIGQHVHQQSLTAAVLNDTANAILAGTPADATAALDKLIHEAEVRGQAKAGAIFATSGAEARYVEDGENACPACNGSGHKDDASAALDRIRQEAANEALERVAKMIERTPSRQERLGGQSFAYIKQGETIAAILALKGGA